MSLKSYSYVLNVRFRSIGLQTPSSIDDGGNVDKAGGSPPSAFNNAYFSYNIIINYQIPTSTTKVIGKPEKSMQKRAKFSLNAYLENTRYVPCRNLSVLTLCSPITHKLVFTLYLFVEYCLVLR
uniref:Uncharacterized protein n=5 Tax=Enterobacterales TaxID=91347 RepID=A0A223LLW2_MORMO|nr:Hypothetical protein [Klebsiella aerogenes]ASU04968.1 Hypothetical protein [Proteus mirabilis]ASU05029.1 Hypothetical protein [Morganella morganii]ASU05253.1 Hypothetical protein [Serratia marcescens]